MDLDWLFREHMQKTANEMLRNFTTSTSAPEQPPKSADDIIADIRRVQEELGPPPPEVRLSRYVPAFITAKPTAQPRTDDMRAMVEDIGPQKVSGGYQIGSTIFFNPVHFKEPTNGNG